MRAASCGMLFELQAEGVNLLHHVAIFQFSAHIVPVVPHAPNRRSVGYCNHGISKPAFVGLAPRLNG